MIEGAQKKEDVYWRIYFLVSTRKGISRRRSELLQSGF